MKKWIYNVAPIQRTIITILLIIILISSLLLIKYENNIENVNVRTHTLTEQEKELIALENILKDIQEKERKSTDQDIYIWNENGIIVASNTNHPMDNDSVRVIESVSDSITETKYIKHGGSILVPVVVGNNGNFFRINMVLDTGCSMTLLDEEIAIRLDIKKNRFIQTTLANGSKIISRTAKIDFLQLGPHQEMNFKINTMPIQGRNKKKYGLLGMNFLEKHPFTIDHNRQVILWR